MIWPTGRQFVTAIRRGRVLELGLTEPAVETLMNLEPHCSWPGHTSGTNGCEPDAPAEYVVRFRPHCRQAEYQGEHAVTLLICQAQQIRLRGGRHATQECVCGETVELLTLLDFLGPIIEYYPETR